MKVTAKINGLSFPVKIVAKPGASDDSTEFAFRSPYTRVRRCKDTGKLYAIYNGKPAPVTLEIQ
jgi:hypothetical protein